MKKLFTVTSLFGCLSWFASPALAAPSLEQLLSAIKEDISANRLSSPANNNALEHINQFRQQAPFDFRVVPLVYQWGEAYVALANKAMDNRQYELADEYLDKVYHVAALTAGLEEAQERLDGLYDPAQAKTLETQQPSREDLERQRQLEALAAVEKAKVEAENRRKAEEDRRLAQEARRKAEEERKHRQELERLRRQELAEEQAAQKLTAEAQPQPTAIDNKPKRTLPPMFNQAAISAHTNAPVASSSIVMQEDNSAVLASFDVPVIKVRERDLSIAKDLAPICQAVVDKDASIVIQTADKSDYRWLIVRMTLCVRDIDQNFRLRYSQQNNPRAGKISISLHPARDSSLIRILQE